MLTDTGIWVSERHNRTARPGAGLLLDRDGVLIEETNYIHRREDVALEGGAVELLAWAKQQQVPVGVTTNQAGIARELFSWRDYCAVESELDRQLAVHGLELDLTVACPFHPEFTPGYGKEQAYWRKPGPGMPLLAGKILGITLADSWSIGDKDSDIAAAKNAGLRGAIHVLTGHGAVHRQAAMELASAEFWVVPANNLIEATAILAARWG